jgi:predicted Zn finger-like uncharacterized protein
MKITCQVCQAKYSIADERVAGKTVKIKCKKCGTAIVVHGSGNESAAVTAPAESAALMGMQPAAEGEEDGETRVFAGDHGIAPTAVAAAVAATPGDEWTVNVSDNDQRTMTTAQIVSEYQRGAIPGDAYVWKDGMADWLALANVPELMQLVASGSPQVAAQASPQYGQPVAAQASPQYGQDGTMVMHNATEGAPAAAAAAAPATAATPTAARRATNRGGGVDVFTAAEGRQGGAAPAAAPPVPPGDRRVGERNETSVLFSLSALTAAEGASRGGKSTSDDGLIDMRPSPSAPRNHGRDNARGGLDDIMNLGGGISGSPMLAPPPMLAPVIEPPPMAPVVAPMAPMASGGMASGGMASGGMASPMYAMPEPPLQKKSKTGLIVGVLGFLVVLGGVGAYFATREAPPVPTPTTAETATAKVPSSAPSTAPAETAAAAPTETAAPAATPSSEPSNAPAAAAPVGGRPVARPTDRPADKPKPEEKPPEEKPAPKAEEKPAPAAAAGKEFDRAAALSALSSAASSARGCKKPDGPTGSGKVKVTFAPSGNVTSSTVDGPPFAGTPVGGCVASAFRGAHVPPFDGAPVSVSKTFNIN